MSRRSTDARRERVVILGAGFARLAAAKTLGDAPYDVTVIDRHNDHLFRPLLYHVATAELSPADIAAPIRSVLGPQHSTTVQLAEVSAIALDRRVMLAEFWRLRLSGLRAWLLGCVAHIWVLIGFRNRLSVTLNWM